MHRTLAEAGLSVCEMGKRASCARKWASRFMASSCRRGRAALHGPKCTRHGRGRLGIGSPRGTIPSKTVRRRKTLNYRIYYCSR